MPQPNISFIGQYFTVYAYGKTRLYTTIHSMNFDNRLFVEGVLKGLGFKLPNRRLTINYDSKERGLEPIKLT